MSGRNLVETDTELIDRYENFLLSKGKEDDKKRDHSHFHPSGFGSCLRKVALEYFGMPKDAEIEPRVRRIFSAGHTHHDRMQKEFAIMGILRGYWRCKRCGKLHGTENKWGIFCPRNCGCEEVLPDDFKSKKLERYDLFNYEEISVGSDEYHFGGHCDGVIELVKDSEEDRYVVDFKTIRSEKFEFLNAPDKVYITQIRIYMWLLGINQGIIFYEEKNSHGLKAYKVFQDPHVVEELKKNSKLLWDLLQKKKIPTIPKYFVIDKKPCTYCDFKKRCWDMDKKRKANA